MVITMQPREMLRDDITKHSNLNRILSKLLPEYANYNDDRIYNFTSTLTMKQYRRMLALYFQKQNKQIKEEFEEYLQSLKQPTNENN